MQSQLGGSFHHVATPTDPVVPDDAGGLADQRAQLLDGQRLQREVQQDCVLYNEQLE